MRGTFDRLRSAHAGNWLLIRTDGPEEQSGTLLFVHEDAGQVEEEALRQPKEPKGARPLYTTYPETEEDKDLIFVL